MQKYYRGFPMLYLGIENHFLCKNEHNQSVSPNNTRMKKTINGIAYYIPNNLTQEQEAIYTHIIDWKRKNITTERGFYGNHEYDSIFPERTKHPAMMYEPIKTAWDEMQDGNRFAYKLHQFAHHAVSSQTACINLFMPLLLSDKANHILPRIPGSPADFKEIAEDKLFRGFCFEYWGQDMAPEQGVGKSQDSKNFPGVLNDHTPWAGTDADVAIAYYNQQGQLCLWLIEHKLSEREFTTCGGYKSKIRDKENKIIENCTRCKLAEIAREPQKCHYHNIGYKYWDILNKHLNCFQGSAEANGCPFRDGLNQLWRNQMLAFALQETGTYQTVTFSVCHHARNTMLNRSIKKYQALTGNDPMFSSFTNYDVLEAVSAQVYPDKPDNASPQVGSDEIDNPDTHSPHLQEWIKWYREVYCF